MARVSPLMFVPPVLFAGLAALFYIGMFRENPDELPSALAGEAAPAVAVTPLGDLPVFSQEVLTAEGVKLVNYWASWCAPCRAEHPNLSEIADSGIPIYGINYKDDPDKALAFLDELGNPYAAVGADATGRMALEWGVYGVPETYVIDGEGRIVLRIAGPITQRTLTSTVWPAIRAAGG